MAKTNFESVDEYLSAQADGARENLRRVRAAIRKALPEAEELISYQIPAYRVNGRIAIYFAGWSKHYSIYPASVALVAALREELAGYELAKGTIRFPHAGRVPVGLIARIAKFRAMEIGERGAGAASARARTKKRGAGAAQRPQRA